MASVQALCNDLIRIWVSRSNYITLNPAATGATQINHFIEVQHVVCMLFSPSGPITEGAFFKVPLGYFIDLSTYISGHSNLYQITAANNTTKLAIPWAQHAPGVNQSAFIAAYLGFAINFNGQTVAQTVQAMAVEMANRSTTYGFLTRFVGQKICEAMGWPGGVLTLAQKTKAGDFNHQPWQ